MSTEIKDFLPFASSLFGAFCGAMGAYWVGRFKEDRDESKQWLSALLASQYALHSQWSVLEDLRKTHLEPFRKDDNRHGKFKNYIRTTGELSVPFDELSFVLDSGEPNTLQVIHVAEKNFQIAIDLLDKLNNQKTELQKKYTPANFDNASGKGQLTVKAHEVFEIKELTDLLYHAVDRALPNLKKTNEMLYDFVKKHLKGKKALKFVSIDQSEAS